MKTISLIIGFVPYYFAGLFGLYVGIRVLGRAITRTLEETTNGKKKRK